MRRIRLRGATLTLALILNGLAQAHDPVFGIGPHVLFKEGVDLGLEIDSEKAAGEKERALAAEIVYGLTGDWAVGVDLPYVFKEDGADRSEGRGDLAVFTKYRFWRRDSLGQQESAAVLLKVIGDTGATATAPRIGQGATDSILGLAYGYESRKWYRWTSLRYRFNGADGTGLERGDMMRLDFVGGIRPRQTGYLEPDTVWLLELNGEYGLRARQNGIELANTGGQAWFLSPGIFWTLRNFAIKAGVQIPLYQDLNGNQPRTDYRAKLVFEWHM